MKVKDCGLGKCVLDMTTQEAKPKSNIWLHMTKMLSLTEDTIIKLERAWRTSFSLTIRSMCTKITTNSSNFSTVIRKKNWKFSPTIGKNVDDCRYLKSKMVISQRKQKQHYMSELFSSCVYVTHMDLLKIYVCFMFFSKYL